MLPDNKNQPKDLISQYKIQFIWLHWYETFYGYVMFNIENVFINL